MLSERAQDALLAVRNNILLAVRWMGDMDESVFAEERARFYAVTRCLEIISEASRRLPTELTTRHPSYPCTGRPAPLAGHHRCGACA